VEFADRIRTTLEDICRAQGTPFTVSTAIGWSKLENEGDSFAECMGRADQQLYLNKKEMKSGSEVR
jgi:GGDEF domain-containing protein